MWLMYYGNNYERFKDEEYGVEGIGVNVRFTIEAFEGDEKFVCELLGKIENLIRAEVENQRRGHSVVRGG